PRVFRRTQDRVRHSDRARLDLRLVALGKVECHVAESRFQDHVARRRISPLCLADPGGFYLSACSDIVGEAGTSAVKPIDGVVQPIQAELLTVGKGNVKTGIQVTLMVVV